MFISLENVSLDLYESGRLVSKKIRVLDSISLNVKQGENIGIIGKNGAGKSSLLKLLAGIYSPSSGKIVNRFKHVALATLQLGFDYELTGRDNIVISGLLMGFPYKDILNARSEIIDFSGVGSAIDRPMKTYSSGMSARVAFAVAFVLQADLMLIDEVLSVGDESFQKKCESKFEQMLSSDKTLIIVSHDLNFVNRCCNRVLELGNGGIRNVT